MDPNDAASSELTALLQAQDGDAVQHQHLAVAADDDDEGPAHTRADYEASRRAVVQISGQCCRVGCMRPAWRNPGGGRGSAFCTSRHANRFGTRCAASRLKSPQPCCWIPILLSARPPPPPKKKTKKTDTRPPPWSTSA